MSLEMLCGFDVHSCGSGEAGIRVARDLDPDLILLDVMMPGLDGPTTLRVMRNDPKLRGTPIVLMTARVQPREIEEYLALGAAGVIPKPFDPMKLGEQLGSIWATHQAKARSGMA